MNKNRAIEKQILELTAQYEKKIYDLEQLLDISRSFCSTLEFSKLLESIVYICMAQMHVLGAGIFIRDTLDSDDFILETTHSDFNVDCKKQYIIPEQSYYCADVYGKTCDNT